MGGTISVGRVVKVHHKSHTADVILSETKDKIIGSASNEGSTACQILERHAGWDSEYESFYGDITPIQVGELVAVAFLDNRKSRPVIIGTLHESANNKNPMPEEYPLDELEEDEKFTRLSVSRTQDYNLTKGGGEKEIAHHSKAFMVSSERDIDDSRDGFDYEDLSVKNKLTGEVIKLPESKKPFQPLDFLFSLRNKFSKAADFLKLWVSAKTCEFRVSREGDDNTLTTVGISEDGAFKVTRQLDSNIRGKSSNYSEATLSSDGSILISKVSGDKTTTLVIESDGGIKLSSNNPVSVSSDKSIKIQSQESIDIESPKVNIKG